MHRLHRELDGSVTLYVGAENWPFPIPLAEKDGAWKFDADAGRNEVLFRRIGENELTAIAISHELAAAEKQHHPPANALVSLLAKAASEPAGTAPVLAGYCFRVLTTHPANTTRPGRFAVVAYPAEYRSSGVMTFVVTENNVVYEKDLGANTSALAGAMVAFHKDATWRVSDE
jgi:hypothetical protein